MVPDAENTLSGVCRIFSTNTIMYQWSTIWRLYRYDLSACSRVEHVFHWYLHSVPLVVYAEISMIQLTRLTNGEQWTLNSLYDLQPTLKLQRMNKTMQCNSLAWSNGQWHNSVQHRLTKKKSIFYAFFRIDSWHTRKKNLPSMNTGQHNLPCTQKYYQSWDVYAKCLFSEINA